MTTYNDGIRKKLKGRKKKGKKSRSKTSKRARKYGKKPSY